MKVWHDSSYVTDLDRQLIARGFAQEGYHSLRFSYVYTPAEREVTRQTMHSFTPEVWHQLCVQDAAHRSSLMHTVIEEINKHFPCYQYDKEKNLHFDDPSWDFFFWCNDFYNTCRDSNLTGRDYSYFTLSFNKKHDLIRQREVCHSVLQLLDMKFADWPNLDVAIQHSAYVDSVKIQSAVDAAIPAILNRPCQYANMAGKVVKTGEGYFFKKKYARKYGYRLSDSELLRISWELPDAESSLEACHA